MSESIERLLERALAMEPERRRHFVEEACGGDPQLRDELMSLVAQADAAEGFFALLTDAVFTSSPPGESERLPSQPEDEELRAGDMIGHYRIVARIATGGMGNVYRARDTRLDRDIALKFIPPSPGASPEAEERLLMEARAAAALEHPNVCSIHQVGETDGGRLFIAMACYDGETLKERLRRAPMSVEESVATALQIARGLAAAHARGIIHRDVKPGNVMLVSDGTVRLLDFGLAVAMNATMTRPGATPGTVAYMSPEQVRGGALDARTDLWSLGVVLYEMLGGVRPNRGASAPELVYTILREEPVPIGKRLPDLDARLARVVDRLLQKDPTARYQGAAEVIADLEDSLAEAHYTRGRIREAMLDFGSAETQIRRAIALDPVRSIYRRSLAYLRAWAWRPKEELDEARRWLETDPLNPYAHVAVAGALFANRRYDEALAQLDRLAAIQPPLQSAPFTAAQCYAMKQMWPEAIAALRPRAEAGDPVFGALLGHMLARSGARDEALRILADLMARRERTGVGAFQIAVVHAGLGDFDQAFAWLDRSIDDRSIGSLIMALTFEDLHRDPRFARLRTRLGLQPG